ncbi:MAG: SUMF1/EgtB/PvdO family nonheme iron enzyme [Phycisphaerae bacterium]|jgi:formylglycine-generating enzyme required for sulfatase activity
MKKLNTICAVVAVMLAICGVAQAAITIDTVAVGNVGNAVDTHGSGYGAVNYAYSMGKYEVTSGQYTEFLNKVAATDAYGLYGTDMGPGYSFDCGITRTGSSGSYSYSVDSSFVNRPVNNISWGDAARFANWMSNGQPTGAQTSATTEDGSYYLNGATSNSALMAVTRKAGATWVIPNENEWYKAAYYDAVAAGYYNYATGTDTKPSKTIVNPDPGNNANINHALTDPYSTVVGEFENSGSPYGTFDQTGNIDEWTESAFDASNRIRRGGGSFNVPSGYLDMYDIDCGYNHNVPTNDSYSNGLRVAFIPEPATMCLLGLGGLLLRRKK